MSRFRGIFSRTLCSRTLIWISVVLSCLWWALVCLAVPFCTPCAEMALVPEPCSMLPIRFVVSCGETRQFTCNVLNATAHWISVFTQRLSEEHEPIRTMRTATPPSYILYQARGGQCPRACLVPEHHRLWHWNAVAKSEISGTMLNISRSDEVTDLCKFKSDRAGIGPTKVRTLWSFFFWRTL